MSCQEGLGLLNQKWPACVSVIAKNIAMVGFRIFLRMQEAIEVQAIFVVWLLPAFSLPLCSLACSQQTEFSFQLRHLQPCISLGNATRFSALTGTSSGNLLLRNYRITGDDFKPNRTKRQLKLLENPNTRGYWLGNVGKVNREQRTKVLSHLMVRFPLSCDYQLYNHKTGFPFSAERW